jgi:N6-adenosine-specific RNA methylase IME4
VGASSAPPSATIASAATAADHSADGVGVSNGFDAIMMDPPWQLATANPTRGVALGYSQLTDADIENLPIPALQPRSGYLFVWVINAKYKFCLDLFDKWGYE